MSGGLEAARGSFCFFPFVSWLCLLSLLYCDSDTVSFSLSSSTGWLCRDHEFTDSPKLTQIPKTHRADNVNCTLQVSLRALRDKEEVDLKSAAQRGAKMRSRAENRWLCAVLGCDSSVVAPGSGGLTCPPAAAAPAAG